MDAADPAYTITVTDPNGTGGWVGAFAPGGYAELSVAAGTAAPNGIRVGEVVTLNIPDSFTPTTRTLSQVTIGDYNLTMGQLTRNAMNDGWTYTFRIDTEGNIKTQVVYRDLELVDPIE